MSNRPGTCHACWRWRRDRVGRWRTPGICPPPATSRPRGVPAACPRVPVLHRTPRTNRSPRVGRRCRAVPANPAWQSGWPAAPGIGREFVVKEPECGEGTGQHAAVLQVQGSPAFRQRRNGLRRAERMDPRRIVVRLFPIAHRATKRFGSSHGPRGSATDDRPPGASPARRSRATGFASSPPGRCRLDGAGRA